MTIQIAVIRHLALLLILFLIPETSSAIDMEQKLGIGIGLPYGGFGLNYEPGVHPNIVPTIGAGYLFTPLWNAGIRAYYPDRIAPVSGRATVLYGTSTVLEKNHPDGSSDYESRYGPSIGLGVCWRFVERWAVGVDLFYIDRDIPAGYDQKNTDVVLSLGFINHW